MNISTAFVALARRIPVTTQARVVLDNDWAADPDGMVALVHHLLADSAAVRAVTCTSIPILPGDQGLVDPAQPIAVELIERLGVDRPPVSGDAAERFDPTAPTTLGAQAIIAEALRDDDLPLFVACGGPLTNVASALHADPSIAERLTLVWIGGGAHPDGAWEYNLMHDLEAARFVFNETRVPIIQVPQATYRQCAMSVVELEMGLTVAGDFGAWLYDRFTSPPDFVRIGGVWPMGDSPPVLITALGIESSMSRTVETPWITEVGLYAQHPEPRPLEVYDTLDVRLLFADFFARLQRWSRKVQP